MPEMLIKQPGFSNLAHLLRIQKFMPEKDTNYIYKKYLDKACFQCVMAHGNYKNLVKRTRSNKFPEEKGFKILSNSRYNWLCIRGLAAMVSIPVFSIKMFSSFFNKKSTNNGIKSMPNQELAHELHKPFIKKF